MLFSSSGTTVVEKSPIICHCYTQLSQHFKENNAFPSYIRGQWSRVYQRSVFKSTSYVSVQEYIIGQWSRVYQRSVVKGISEVSGQM